MQKMTLEHTVRTRRFLEEHYDNCTECGRQFNNSDTTNLGYTSDRNLVYVGNCCSNILIETIIRHVYQKRCYLIPDDNSTLWRFMDFTKFVSLLKTKSLFFTRADRFQDPFEGAKGILRNKVKWDKYYTDFFVDAIRTAAGSENTNKSQIEVLREAKKLLDQINKAGEKHTKETFINCWYENKYESEAMWKLYTSSLDQGIAIKTTYHRLYTGLYRNPDIKIGRVNYIDFNTNFAGINDSFWYKRKSFEHEREVRAVLKNFRTSEEFGMLVKVNIDVLIDKIFLSPTAQPWFKELVQDVMTKYELRKRIEDSDMTTKPFF